MNLLKLCRENEIALDYHHGRFGVFLFKINMYIGKNKNLNLKFKLVALPSSLEFRNHILSFKKVLKKCEN